MEKSKMIAQRLEVSLLGVGTVLRLERDAWSMVKLLRQATNEYTPPPSPPSVVCSVDGERMFQLRMPYVDPLPTPLTFSIPLHLDESCIDLGPASTKLSYG